MWPDYTSILVGKVIDWKASPLPAEEKYYKEDRNSLSVPSLFVFVTQ